MTSPDFKRRLAADLAARLGDRYRFFRSRLELRAETRNGHDVLILAGSTKYSPHVTIEFYFGRNFAEAKRIEKRLGGHQFPYHIQQFSLNRKHMTGLAYSGPYTWTVDINRPPENLVLELTDAVRGMAVPFFERFSDIGAARDAIAADDSWCFGGRTSWRQLLLLDMAMGDLRHFEDWREELDDLSQQQASEMIASFKEATARVV